MNNALITDEQRIVLLANGRESLENPDFDPAPVVKLFTPDAGARYRPGRPRPRPRLWSL